MVLQSYRSIGSDLLYFCLIPKQDVRGHQVMAKYVSLVYQIIRFYIGALAVGVTYRLLHYKPEKEY